MSFSSPKGGDPPKAMTGDRRVHVRRAIVPRLYVILDSANSDGILNDVSEGGLALDIVGSQPEGEHIVVDFEMAEIGQHFEAKGRITWRDEAGKKVGVHFVDLPEASRNQIREWLSKKVASAEPAQPTIVQDSERYGIAVPRRVRQALGALEREESSKPAIKPPSAHERERSGNRDGERLVQSLIDSFSKQHGKPPDRTVRTQLANIISSGQEAFSAWVSRRWIVLTAGACLAVVLVLGVVAYRSLARNVGRINVSKVGRRPNAEAPGTTFSDGANSGGQVGGGHDGNAQGTGGSDGSANGSGPPTSEIAASAFSSSLPNASLVGHPPCLNLGPPSDKIRIYLWAEKDTPDAIVAAYSKYLEAVLDVHVVYKAPYDLVLYVNGANAGAKGAESGFIWSSRVFRPWYCGQTLGLLEQTQVNQSLHYVQGANLDQHIQAEVAYLILHTFESIRNEHTR